jgi:hypothetical protein
MSTPRRVVHLSDVEGSYNRLRTFVLRAPGLSFDEAGDIVVDDDTVFVFGGDAVDRGPWSRRVLVSLWRAQQRFPERVVLLGGNRDINKLRLPRELAGALPRKAPPEVHALVKDNKPALLRWIFSHTMGAQPAFDFRRDELLADDRPAGDDDVVASFIEDLLPEQGLQYRYLREARLAYRFHSTLFLHGGFADEALGHVPGRARVDDVDAWIAGLNEFYREQLAAYAASPYGVADRLDEEPPWFPIVLYQAPKRGVGRNPESVVYGRFGSDPWNNPRLPSSSSMRWLVQHGIRRVVVGHTPCGDVPAVLRSAEGLELVIADNSRGRVDEGVVVCVDGGDGADDVVAIDAVTTLDDESNHRVRFSVRRDEETMIGSVTTDGRLVKGFLDDGRALLFRSDESFAIRQTAVDVADLGPLLPPVDDSGV